MFVQSQCMIRWPETPWGWRPAEQWTGRGEDQDFVFVVRRGSAGGVVGAHIAYRGEVLPTIYLTVSISGQSATVELHGRASSITGAAWWSDRATTGNETGNYWRLYRVALRPEADEEEGEGEGEGDGEEPEPRLVWILHHGLLPEGSVPRERTWTDSNDQEHWDGDEFWMIDDNDFPAIAGAAVAMTAHGTARENGYTASIRAEWSRVWSRNFTGDFNDAAGKYSDSWTQVHEDKRFGTPTWYRGSGSLQETIRASLEKEEDTGKFYYTGAFTAAYDSNRSVWRTAGGETWWQTGSDPEQSVGLSVTFTKYAGGEATQDTRTFAPASHDGLSVEHPEELGDAWIGRIALWR